MAKQNRNTLKGYFETGDIPTGANYVDLIDSPVIMDTENTGSINLQGTGSFSEISISSTGSFGSVSASGTIIGLTGSFGELLVDQYIKHTGDADTRINFMDNKIQLEAGGIAFIQMDKDSSTPYPLTVNSGGNRINFRVQDKDSNLLLKADSEAFKVNLYYAGSQKLETATGGVNITGEITSSGNISSSGTISAFGSSSLVGLPTTEPSVTGALWLSGSGGGSASGSKYLMVFTG